MIWILLLLQDNPAANPRPRDEKWLKKHEALVEEAKKGGVDVLFLGDSITEGWKYGGKKAWEKEFKPLKAANFGISGDSTHHVLWRLQNGELDGLKPRAVVLMIGTNNMGAHSPEQIAGGVEAILKELRKKLPDAKVLLLAIFPRGEKPDTMRERVKKTNDLLAKLADGKSVVYLDIGDGFVGKDGLITKEIMPDFLHLSAKGYEIWAEAIREPLGKLLK